MGIRQFFRSLRSSRGEERPPGPEDELAEDVRETMGPQAGAGAGGRMTGEAVYHHLEDHEQQKRSDDD